MFESRPPLVVFIDGDNIEKGIRKLRKAIEMDGTQGEIEERNLSHKRSQRRKIKDRKAAARRKKVERFKGNGKH